MCLGVNHRPAFGCVKAAIVAQLASVITPFLLRKTIAIATICGVDPQADATTQYDQNNYLVLEPQNPTAKASDSPRCDIAIKTFEQHSGQTALTALTVSANSEITYCMRHAIGLLFRYDAAKQTQKHRCKGGGMV